mmetsp:Transcript_6882/g.20284  ORF Transcript_6882/g.20284 Transcript_6882/m.20284 type:complete len:96 (+) Transcript_6882:515-802(+)
MVGTAAGCTFLLPPFGLLLDPLRDKAVFADLAVAAAMSMNPRGVDNVPARDLAVPQAVAACCCLASSLGFGIGTMARGGRAKRCQAKATCRSPAG